MTTFVSALDHHWRSSMYGTLGPAWECTECRRSSESPHDGICPARVAAALDCLVVERDTLHAKVERLEREHDEMVDNWIVAARMVEARVTERDTLHAKVERLSAEVDEARTLLCTDGTVPAALVRLGAILVDAGIEPPVCNRAPTCGSLHLTTRIDSLADERDNALAQVSRLRAGIQVALDCDAWSDGSPCDCDGCSALRTALLEGVTNAP